MRITPRWMAFLVVSILFGGILLANALGVWTTKSTKEPLTFTEGEFAGEYDPADIRGSYTFGDVSRLFEIPIEDLAVAFRVPDADVAAVSLKTLEERFVDLGVDLGTSSVRLFVALYKGLPFDLSGADTYLLPEAATILKQKASLSPEQLAYLESHTLVEGGTVLLATPAPEEVTRTEVVTEATPTSAPTGGDGNAGGGSGTPNPEHTPEANKVGGKTTFQNLLDWGVKQEDIAKAIGQVLPLKSLVIKDWATSQGLTFSSLKEQLQGLVDAVK